jgi:hypothetical protein
MRLVQLVLAVGFAACGNTSDPASPALGGAGTGAEASGGEPSLQAGGATSGAAGSAAAASGSAGAASGSAGAASSPLADQPLQPLIAGRVSSFAFSSIDAGRSMTGTCPNPTTSMESGEGLSFDGHMGTLYRTFCAEEPFLLEGTGDDLTAYEINDGELLPQPVAYIQSPVVSGEMWDSGRGDRYTWQELTEPLETPAGTFEACWHRDGADTRMTYCRGVGLVRALDTYGNYQLDLVAKNF